MDSRYRVNTYLYTFSFVNTYILYRNTQTQYKQTCSAHKYLHCAGIEPEFFLCTICMHLKKYVNDQQRCISICHKQLILWSQLNWEFIC
jgi:hypothetical protein